jgi:hypothetical protein
MRFARCAAVRAAPSASELVQVLSELVRPEKAAKRPARRRRRARLETNVPPTPTAIGGTRGC